MTPAVFLDRDGTIVEECGYLNRLEKLTLFPWTVDALRLIKRAGFATVVITNQAAVGRGIIAEDIDRYYYCPHFAESKIERYRQECLCRKPAPGMVQQACRDMDLDPTRSVMVGDRWLDVACGRAAGARAVLVQSGPERSDPPSGVHADAILNNLMEAVGWILRSSSPSSTR
jgi:D-glycero-D-manno-heptose 1,7-bisphosphate phosphatase